MVESLYADCGDKENLFGGLLVIVSLYIVGREDIVCEFCVLTTCIGDDLTIVKGVIIGIKDVTSEDWFGLLGTINDGKLAKN